MKFLSPIPIPKPLAPINDQNLKIGIPVVLFKRVFEIRFFDALLATEVIVFMNSSSDELVQWPEEEVHTKRSFVTQIEKIVTESKMIQ